MQKIKLCKDPTIDFSVMLKNEKKYIWDLFKIGMKPYIENIWGWNQEFQVKEFEKNMTFFQTIIIKVNSKYVGYIQYSFNETETYLHMFIIHPKFRCSGYGVKVLDLLKSLRPDKPLILECLRINPRAYSFYINYGFKKIKKSDIFYILKFK